MNKLGKEHSITRERIKQVIEKQEHNRNIMKSFLYVIINNSLLATIIIGILSVIKNPTIGGLIGLLFIGMLWLCSVSILIVGVSVDIEKIKEENQVLS